MQSNYSVLIEKFAERHYIKNFEKKYKKYWEVSLRAIIAGLERVDMLVQTDKAEVICESPEIRIVKTRFRVAGTKESAKTSGNRCIVAWCEGTKEVSILLVYTKTDLSGHNETVEWKQLIKNNYKQYQNLF